MFGSQVKFYGEFISSDRFPNLKNLAMQITATMGTTYACESFFSKLKQVKTKSRNRLTDTNLKNQLRCATTSLEVDFSELKKQ